LIRSKSPFLLAALLAGGCRGSEPVDLLAAGKRLVEARVAGRDRVWVDGQSGKSIRINDVLRRTLPASPPSLLRFTVDIPKGAHLTFSYGIPEERHDKPGVEFFVKVRRAGREDAIWSALVDPLSRPEHREWLRGDVDLSRFAGPGRDLILETRGFEEEDDPRRAFWGVPAITVPHDDDAPLVVVYLVDTLRADHTQPYGYSRDTTPELAKFAQDAIVFEQAIAQASWTKPSVASLFTSLPPGKHQAIQLQEPLDSAQLTLAEMLRAKGYSTGAAIANWIIYTKGSNMDQGFDSFAGLHGARNRPSKHVEAAVVVDEALQWLDSRPGFKRFLYVHTLDPHVPYTPPPPFDQKYEPHPAPGHPGIDPRTDYLEPQDRERMIAQYDGDIAYGDREFGRFVRGLKERGLYDRALVVFTADHGEEFLDHGKWLHGRSVFDELVHIPMIVKLPGQKDAGRRVRDQVRTVDILPTILENEGLPQPPGIMGRPLQQVLAGAPELPALSEISHRGFVAFGIRTGHDKYVWRFSPEDDELYFDLAKDPREQQDRAGEARERVRALKPLAESAMVTDSLRRKVRVQGEGSWELTLTTRGWIDAVETANLSPAEGYEIQDGGRLLQLRLRPQAGRAREVAFGIRPIAAPVWVEGTRDGRPLQPGEVYIAEEMVHPQSIPARFADVEAEHEQLNVFVPPPTGAPGLLLWLQPVPGRHMISFDKEAQERLKALGYLGPN
jgi:arylsulfatase A-like enzyme